ncbi:MAG: hypothetical protein WC928_03800 [Patescibacteria group bacterium]|jgi:hypothetical protein
MSSFIFKNSKGEELSLADVISQKKKIILARIHYPVVYPQRSPNSKKIVKGETSSDITGDISIDFMEAVQVVSIKFSSQKVFDEIINFDDEYLSKSKIISVPTEKPFHVDIHADNLKKLEWE